MFKQNFHKSFRQLNFSQDHLNFSVQNYIKNIYCFEIILKVFNPLLCMTKPTNSLKFIIHGIFKFSSMSIVLADTAFLWKIGQYFQQGGLPYLHAQGRHSSLPPRHKGSSPLCVTSASKNEDAHWKLNSCPLHWKM